MPSLRYCMSNNFYTWMLCQLWRYKKHIARQQFCITCISSKKLFFIFGIGGSMYKRLFSKFIFIASWWFSSIRRSHDISINCIFHNDNITNNSCNAILIVHIQKWIEWTFTILATKNSTIFHITSELK